MRVCSLCGDVVLYCTCMLESERESDSPNYTDNPSFSIYLGTAEVKWDSETRSLSGDGALIQQIEKHLHEKYEVVLQPGFGLWMSVRDPNAVYYVAKDLLKGCSFSETAPDWSEITNPDNIY